MINKPNPNSNDFINSSRNNIDEKTSQNIGPATTLSSRPIQYSQNQMVQQNPMAMPMMVPMQVPGISPVTISPVPIINIDPMNYLANCKKIHFTEMFRTYMDDCCHCCNCQPLAIKYNVYGYDQNDIKGHLFTCELLNDCCNYCCCSYSHMKFDMDIKIPSLPGSVLPNNNIYAKIHRNTNFTFFCFACCRPEYKIYKNDGSFLGKIRYPWGCDPKIEVYDKNDRLIYFVTGSCCQRGFYCSHSCCGENVESYYNLVQAEPESVLSGLTIRNLNYFLDLPNSAPPEHKFLIIFTNLMMDLQELKGLAGCKLCIACCPLITISSLAGAKT